MTRFGENCYFEKILFNLNQATLSSKALWLPYKHALSCLKFLVRISSQEFFQYSKYDTIIIDGELVRGKVTDSVDGNIASKKFSENLNDALRIVVGQFLIPGKRIKEF